VGTARVVFHVRGLGEHPEYVQAIEDTLSRMAGVAFCTVRLPAETVFIEYDPAHCSLLQLAEVVCTRECLRGERWPQMGAPENESAVQEHVQAVAERTGGPR